jgi:hypothetical protein
VSLHDRLRRGVAREVFSRVASGPSTFRLPDGDEVVIQQVSPWGQGAQTLMARIVSEHGAGEPQYFVVRIKEVPEKGAPIEETKP